MFKRELNAKLVLSVIATGIMSFSGVVVETAMNVNVSNVDGGILYWHLNGTMDDHLVPFDSCHHHAYVIIFK